MNELLHVQTTSVGEFAVVVAVAGEVDLGTIEPLESEVDAAVGVVTAPGLLVIDLSRVTFLASAGLSLLLATNARCRDGGVSFRTVISDPRLLRVLEVTGLAGHLTVDPALPDAIERHQAPEL